jgi:hypothetical protein
VIRIQRCRELAKRDEETKQAASQDVLLNAACALFRSSALFTLLDLRCLGETLCAGQVCSGQVCSGQVCSGQTRWQTRR